MTDDSKDTGFADEPATDEPADALGEAALEPLEMAEEPAAEAAPADAADPASDPAPDPAEGQWVWQYAAPPPRPGFLSVFFSGTALKELYVFFGCALLVIIGCLLPWGPYEEPVPNTVAAIEAGGPEFVTETLPWAPHAGYEIPSGAISLVIGIWLLLASCYGIYSSRQKILPVFLMIEPAIVTWLRTVEAWGKLESTGPLDQIQELFQVAGTGVMLTLVGSSWVALKFVFLLGKVYAKKDDKGAARRASRSTKKDKDKSEAGSGEKGGDAAGEAESKDEKSKGSKDKDSKDKDRKGRRGRRKR